jgi:uroporphyrinogen decarboxylase
MGSPETIRERALAIIAAGKDAPGHVFNLGHGILPETPVEHAQALVDAVKQSGDDA